MFADYTAGVGDSVEKPSRLLSEFSRVCKKRTLRVNVGRETLCGSRGMRMSDCNGCETKLPLPLVLA